MESPAGEELNLDVSQVKKAVQALQAYLKSTSSQNLISESQQICLLITFWKIPKKEQNIRIPLPHGLHTEATEVCLFTRDEPNMTSEQTERFYKKLLKQRGITYMPEVIPFKVLKTEYKPFEAKRKLLGNFDIFLSDARICRLLPSHIGKHFYQRKKIPLSVDLESKNLQKDFERLVQGTTLKVTKKGACCMVRVAHTEMSTDEMVENISTALGTISAKLHAKGKSIKVVHLKSHTSVALPIYTSDLSHLTMIEEEVKKANLAKGKKTLKKKNTVKPGVKRKVVKKNKSPKAVSKKKVVVDEDNDEIPQLVPIESPSKKPKLEAPSKKVAKKASRPTGGKKVQKVKQGQRKPGQKSPKIRTQKKRKLSSA